MTIRMDETYNDRILYTVTKSVFLDTVQWSADISFAFEVMKGSEIEDEELLQEIKNVPLAARINTLTHSENNMK